MCKLIEQMQIESIFSKTIKTQFKSSRKLTVKIVSNTYPRTPPSQSKRNVLSSSARSTSQARGRHTHVHTSHEPLVADLGVRETILWYMHCDLAGGCCLYGDREPMVCAQDSPRWPLHHPLFLHRPTGIRRGLALRM